jgi:phage recombination protein Bet
MSKQLTKVEEQVVPTEKYALAKEMVAKGASDSEFEMLIHIANKYHLDPLLKEIWCYRAFGNTSTIMTSRDGYLAIAHRSGQLDGMQSGIVKDEAGKLSKAWCEIWRKDMSHSFKAEVDYAEYKQNSTTWQKYPSAMLIKVAEVFALKRAFSISGMLTQEEAGIEEHEPGQGLAGIDTTPPLYAEESEVDSLIRILSGKSGKPELDIIQTIEKKQGPKSEWDDDKLQAITARLKELINECKDK